MTITLDPDIARSLIEIKLRVLTEKIDAIIVKCKLVDSKRSQLKEQLEILT